MGGRARERANMGDAPCILGFDSAQAHNYRGLLAAAWGERLGVVD